MATFEYVLTGLNIDEKQALIERQLRSRMADDPGISELVIQRLGTPLDDPPSRGAASTVLRITAIGPEEAGVGRRFVSAANSLGLSSYPGLYTTMPPPRASAFARYWPALINQSTLEPVMEMDGEHITVPPPPAMEPVPAVEVILRSSPAETIGPYDHVPLGLVVDARSGDKGGDANVGLWTRSSVAYAWLRQYFDVELLRTLLPEARSLEVERYELPRLHALNFVIRGFLREGALSNPDVDAQAKALGEFLRAKHIQVPRAVVHALREEGATRA